MININELRYGNWVDRGGVKYCRWLQDFVPKIEPTGDAKYDSYIVDIEPIPLTPEILVNSGFVLDRTGWVYDEFRIRPKFKTPKHDKFDLVFHPFLDFIGGDRIIKSVHQLQNLYFALTGTELEINIK